MGPDPDSTGFLAPFRTLLPVPDRQHPEPERLVEGVDYTMEGETLVFTAGYLLRRGTCCRSGCRHCPYGFDEEGGFSEEGHGEDGDDRPDPSGQGRLPF